MPWYLGSLPSVELIAAPAPVALVTLPNESYLMLAVLAPLPSAMPMTDPMASCDASDVRRRCREWFHSVNVGRIASQMAGATTNEVVETPDAVSKNPMLGSVMGVVFVVICDKHVKLIVIDSGLTHALDFMARLGLRGL